MINLVLLKHLLLDMIKSIIFDFGAVLIPVDEEGCFQAFEELGARESLPLQKKTFHQLELGKLTSREFVEALRPHFFRKNIFAPDLIAAWNKMVPKAIPAQSIALLRKLQKEYRLFLLSNTNALHLDEIRQNSGLFDYRQFSRSFEKMYFSHEAGMRKPDAAFFEKVLEENELKPEECFFVDDRKENVKSAKKLGMNTWHFLPEEQKIEEITKRIAAL